MKKNEVKIGGTYLAKVSDRVVPFAWIARTTEAGGMRPT
jgi:hypothetical protein